MNWWPAPIIILILWLLFRARGNWAQNKMLGNRLIVNYSDQNEEFRSCLPATGFINRRIKIKHTDFFVLKLEKPIFYEGRDFQELVIRARNFGEQLGSKEESPIHILLPAGDMPSDQSHYEIEDFEQVAWGTIKKALEVV